MDCAVELKRVAEVTEEEIASASRLARALCDSTMMDSLSPNQEFVKVSNQVSDVVISIQVAYLF